MASEKEELCGEYLIDYYVLSHIIIIKYFKKTIKKKKKIPREEYVYVHYSLSLFDCSEKTISFSCQTYHLPMQSTEAFSHEAHNHDPHS